MKFGKLQDISHVDFSLPEDAPGTKQSLQGGASSPEKLRFYIGCTGWSMKEWVGKVYPRGTKSRDFLHQYALQFNTIELNTTHYRIPTIDTVRRWYRETAYDFRFCPKVPQSISHNRDLGLGGTQTALFCDHIRMLEEKLGCCFIQLPPYFGYDRLGLLERFVAQWPSSIPLAVELRHESWFADGDRHRRAFDMLAGHGISAVITDVAGRRDVLHMRATTATTMIRFVGNGLHPTDYVRTNTWVERLRQWFQQGLSTVYFFTHEPDNLLAPELAKYLNDQLASDDRIVSRGPEFFDKAQGEQMSLF
jgi:uncharacterized protein YecE (DUF72 family)